MALVVLLNWPARGVTPELPQPTVPDKRVVHLELASIYEENGLLEEARHEYENAITEIDDDISGFAKQQLQRIIVAQSSPLVKLKTTLKGFLYWIVENLLKFLVILVPSVMFLGLAKVILQQSSYAIISFDDYTGNNQGDYVVQVMNIVIQKSQLVHQRNSFDALAISENVDFPVFGLSENTVGLADDLLVQIDLLSAGAVKLPLAKVISTWRRWLTQPEYVITGQIEKRDNTLKLTAFLIQRRHRGIRSVWEVSSEISSEITQNLPQLATELAFQVLYDLCPQTHASSWKSLQLTSEALWEMKTYDSKPSDITPLQEARKKLELAIALDPTYALAQYNLGLAYNSLGKYQAARDTFKALRDLKLQPQAAISYNLGLAYYHMFVDWAYDYAITAFNEAIAQIGVSTDKRERKLLALSHCGLAGVYAQRIGRGNGAENDYEQAVTSHCKIAREIMPPDQQIKGITETTLGIACLRRGSLQEAISHFRESSRILGDYPANHVYWGEAYLKLDRLDEAIRCFQTATLLRPQHEYAHYRLGHLYANLEDWDRAIEEYGKAPNIAGAHNALGKIFGSQGRYEEAITEFRESVKLNSKLSDSWVNLAWYYLESGRTDNKSLQEATDFARRALQLDEGTPQEWHRRAILGWILLNRNLENEAEEELRKSIDLEPNRMQNRYYLALLYARSNRKEKAMTELAHALELDEKGLWREKAGELMQDMTVD
jgi:tetratricopeptide (TPR) repeat protein